MDLRNLKLIRWEAVEPREYQLKIARNCIARNTLVVLPTGLGKTIIAAIVAAWFLEQEPRKQVLMLAPTKALVEQHERTFKKLLNEDLIISITGKIPPEKRRQFYSKFRIIIATPQVIRNDLLTGKLDPKNFSLVIFDECHRASGNYPYVFIAKEFLLRNPSARIIGLTASHGNVKTPPITKATAIVSPKALPSAKIILPIIPCFA
jgi:ERCC4-related helicase